MKKLYISSVKKKIPSAVCPKCKRPATGGTGLGEKPDPQPKPGDLVVCLYCGALNRYDAKLHPELVTPEERECILGRDPDLRRLVELAERIRAGASGA